MKVMMSSIANSLGSRIVLNDGQTMPIFGLGFNKMDKTDMVTLSAIHHGYRLLDTAEFYGNEADVGMAIDSCGIPRNELFVVSKLWDNGAEVCRKHFKASLKRLNLNYVDLYLIHSPLGGRNVETYKVMLDLQRQGLIRSVGVSNFGVHHLKAIKEAGLPVPVVNQIELHPWQQKTDIVNYCRQEGIAVMGYSPLAKGQRLQTAEIVSMANRYNRTPAQILIRWSVQKGFITIPKSSNMIRITENADVFTWSLTPEDISILDGLPDSSCSWNPCISPWEG